MRGFVSNYAVTNIGKKLNDYLLKSLEYDLNQAKKGRQPYSNNIENIEEAFGYLRGISDSLLSNGAREVIVSYLYFHPDNSLSEEKIRSVIR